MVGFEGGGENATDRPPSEHVSYTAGGTGVTELTIFERRIVSILEKTSLCGNVSEKRRYTDLAETSDEPLFNSYCVN